MEILVPEIGYILMSHWPERFPSSPQTILAFMTAVGCLSELDVKAILLKTLYSLITNYRKNNC